MHPSLSADEVVINRTVGGSTFLRGLEYARAGAVVSVQRQADGERLFGLVRGSGRAPYTSMVFLSHDPIGTLSSFRGSCTCPIRTNCKHTVALALIALWTPEAADPPRVDDDDEQAAPPDWEELLADVVGGTGSAPQDDDAWYDGIGRLASPDEPQVALQFELITPPARWRPEHLTGPRLVMRPVTRGKRGGWVRQGVSWSMVTPGGFDQPRADREHLRLLSELATMDASGYGGYGGYDGRAQTLHLDTVPSRRVWDLLAEGESLGLPYVLAGDGPGGVTLSPDAATMSVDVTRDEDGELAVRPVVIAGDERPTDSGHLLIGSPAHGIAWWHGDGDAQAAAEVDGLWLARLSAPIDEGVRRLLDGGPLRIPAADEERFVATYLGALRERVTVSSSDGTVTVPEPEPPRLQLRVTPEDDGKRIALEWHWDYVTGALTRRESLWPAHRHARGREPATENATIAEVTRLVEPHRSLFEYWQGGLRLAERSRLDLLAAARFVAEVLPGLTAVDGLDVDITSPLPDYREVDEEPDIVIDGGGASDERDWFDLAVTVTIDGEDVPFESLFVALSTGQSHIVLASGTYFSLDRPGLRQLADLIAEARAMQDATAPDTVRLSRYQAGLWDELDKVAVITGQAAEWQRSVQALAQVEGVEPVALPQGLHADLRHYQKDGLDWLAFLYEHSLGGILADDMGLGKTIQALALMCHVRETGLSPLPFLVVAPTSVVGNWAAECHRFAPGLEVAAISETRARRGKSLREAAAGADLVVTSYTLFRLEYEEYAAVQWAGLVLDEAQFVKNHKSQAYRCAKRLPVPFTLAITGTPMENTLMDLWSLLSLTAPGLFADAKRFEQYYRVPIERDRNPDRLAQLRRRIRPFLLRRTKEAVAAELPPKQEQVVEIDLNPRHRRVYQRHLQRERQKVLGLLTDLQANRFEILKSLTLLRQASLDPGLIDPAEAGIPSSKLDFMMELLVETLAEGHRTLVFSQFTRFLDLARARLDEAGIEYAHLVGSTRNRADVIEKFKSGKASVFLISLKAGGFGLNLTEADYVILLDPWWNPATEAQAVDRTHRIGQTEQVMVYRLVASDTIEEKVMALKASKAELVGSVLDGGEFSSAALTAADIRGILG
jgi:superfamily II DNA or RNA helicase